MRSSFPNDAFTGPLLKMERADEHIRELRSSINPLRQDLYSFGMKKREDKAGGTMYSLAYEPKKPVARVLSLTIGDAIHNLRAALDHFATNIVRSKEPNAKPYFPMAKTRSAMEASGALKELEAALPGARELMLDVVRPADDPDQRYWSMLQQFDIIDKHSLIIPNITIVRFHGFHCVSGSTAFHDVGGGGSAERTFYPYSTDRPFSLTGKAVPEVKLTFPEDTPVGGEAVILALQAARRVTGRTLRAFEPLVLNDGS